MTNDLKICLKDDLLFKKIFSDQEVLEDLVNSFFEVMGMEERFKAVKCEAEECILPNSKDKKVFAGDVVATVASGDILNLEIYKNNFGRHEYKKTMCYLTRLYSNQIKSGSNEYEQIRKVIGITFMHGNFRNLNPELINRYKFCKLPEVELIDEGDINCYLVRLDLAEKIDYTLSEKRFYKWLRFINATSISELIEIGKGDKIMENSIRVVQEWYKETSRNALQDALAEERYYGKVDGEKIGKKLGIKQTRFETAKEMLKDNMKLDTIMKYTKLSKKEILSLIN